MRTRMQDRPRPRSRAVPGAKVREIERRGFAEPGRVRGVIFECVARIGVHEDVEPGAVRVEPRDQPLELHRIERKLATPVRVRPDPFFMHAAHLDAEEIRSLSTQRTRLPDRGSIEIDVRVITRVGVARPLHGYSTFAPLSLISCPHFVCSVLMKSANCCGVLVARSAPAPPMRV